MPSLFKLHFVWLFRTIRLVHCTLTFAQTTYSTTTTTFYTPCKQHAQHRERERERERETHTHTHRDFGSVAFLLSPLLTIPSFLTKVHHLFGAFHFQWSFCEKIVKPFLKINLSTNLKLKLIIRMGFTFDWTMLTNTKDFSWEKWCPNLPNFKKKK
jgi:hypothetical protein